jgi:hypothetical protein
MTPLAHSKNQGPKGALRAAARLARDAAVTVRVVLRADPATTVHARDAAEEAGVDHAVHDRGTQVVVHFIARHQDRVIGPRNRRDLATAPEIRANCPPALAPGASGRLPTPRASLAMRHARVPAGVVGRTKRGARIVDLETYDRIVETLGLDEKGDAEAQAICERLARASPQAHVCDGVPALVLDEIQGLVGPLKRRAEQRGVALRINPEDCTCMTD